MIVKWAQLIDGKMKVRRHKITMENEVDNFGFIRSLLGQIGQDPKNYQQPLKRLSEIYNNFGPEDIERYHDYFFSSLRDLGFKPVPALSFARTECILNPNPDVFSVTHASNGPSEPGFFWLDLLPTTQGSPCKSEQDLRIARLSRNIAYNFMISRSYNTLKNTINTRANSIVSYGSSRGGIAYEHITAKAEIKTGHKSLTYSGPFYKMEGSSFHGHIRTGQSLLLNESVAFVPNAHDGLTSVDKINNHFMSTKFILIEDMISELDNTDYASGSTFTLDENEVYYGGNPQYDIATANIVMRCRMNSYYMDKLAHEIEERISCSGITFESDSRSFMMSQKPKAVDLMGASNGYRMPRLEEITRNVERM